MSVSVKEAKEIRWKVLLDVGEVLPDPTKELTLEEEVPPPKVEEAPATETVTVTAPEKPAPSGPPILPLLAIGGVLTLGYILARRGE